MTTSIKRDFLGWQSPALAEAADRITKRYGDGHALNLERVIIVIPGQRAARRLRELLAFLAEEKQLLFTPPQIVTEGRLPELLYEPKRPFATELVQDLSWAQALRDLPADKRRYLVPHPPADAEALGWLRLAKVLRALHTELAADGLDFEAALLHGTTLAGLAEERERWAALVAVQQRYHSLLDGQELWDIQTARLKAIEFREIQTDCDILLLGTVDLNNTLRKMLDLVTEHVAAYIVAPENLADRFDAHGCLIPSAWSEAEVPLQDDQLRQVDGPAEQADAVAAWLADLGGRYQNDEVAIGVPDESLVPQLQRQLEQWDVRARWVEGVHIGVTAPYRLLSAAVAFAGRRRYDDLAAMLRHPDVEDWVLRSLPRSAGHSLPAQLDRFYNTHLPSRFGVNSALRHSEEWPDLAAAVERINAWLKEATTNHSLRVWGGIFKTILGAVFGGRTLKLDDPPDEALHRTIRRILDECDRLSSVPKALDSLALSAADAFQVALGPLAQESLPPPADPEAVEILGWLELPLDDSKALLVTSFNEGFVPQSTGSDAFLPDRLRRELGLMHNERRYARDAYATSVLCHSREELRVLVARRDAEKNPLHPSRLLFACGDDALIRRAQKFFAGQKAPSPPRRLSLAPKGEIPIKSRFEVPRPVSMKDPLKQIQVTRFRDYLACPYRYYLRHVRKLEAVDDRSPELDGRGFGNLIHRALSALGREKGAPRHTTKEGEIFEYLNERLRELARLSYGEDGRRASIRLQLEQARQRLQAFAAKQAELVRDGWRILHAENGGEKAEDLRWPFPVDGKPVELIGRIDRIDYHDVKCVLRILDYKTADAGEPPDKTHRKNGEWIDLQLPLYRHVYQALRLEVPADVTIQLGYFNLPRKLDDTGVHLGAWEKQDIEDADRVACHVIQAIRASTFWKPTYPAPPFGEDFAAICLDNVLSGPGLGDEDEGGPP
jgi:ATP-dependent helicase/nuclease subunit B